MNIAIADRFRDVRKATEFLCEPLTPEDSVVQTMADVSPTKWHLAHTTWFFETFLLEQFVDGYEPLHPEYRVLFNSYYNTVGEQFTRSRRGTLSRPSLKEVWNYRRSIDEQIAGLIETADGDRASKIASLIELGIHHEQQHQELIVTDIKHVFWSNPLLPVYRQPAEKGVRHLFSKLEWVEFEPGMIRIGHDRNGFSFDNEGPRHDAYLQPCRLASRLVTNREYLEFIADDGYRRPELWLSDGWSEVESKRWSAPRYWVHDDGEWSQFTLAGMQPLDLDEPVCHVSFFEADAYARWTGFRLPTEMEWEHAASTLTEADAIAAGNFVEAMNFHPTFAVDKSGLQQMFGDVWEWTASPYVAYPGYRQAKDALGEYNGKFMCNQFVLRGGSCATPRSHIRTTYRNFFQPEKRWQFSGIRLAQDV